MTQAAKRPSASSVRIVLQTKKTISCSDSPAGPLEPTTSIITEPPITPDCSRRSATARPSPCPPWSSCTNRKPCWSLATIRPIKMPDAAANLPRHQGILIGRIVANDQHGFRLVQLLHGEQGEGRAVAERREQSGVIGGSVMIDVVGSKGPAGESLQEIVFFV